MISNFARVVSTTGSTSFSTSAASTAAATAAGSGMPNGLKVISLPSPSDAASTSEETPVTAQLLIRAGSRYNPTGNATSAQFLASAAFRRNGSGKLSHEVAEIMNASGASYEAVADREGITVTTAGLSSELSSMLSVLSGVASGPDVSNPLENDAVVAGMISQADARDDDASAVLADALHATAFGASGLGASPIAPSASLPGGFSADAVSSMVGSTYGASNMVLTVVGGDGNHGDAVASSAFGDISPSPVGDAIAFNEGSAYRGGESRLGAGASSGATFVGVAFAGAGLKDAPSTRAALAVAGAVLGSAGGHAPLTPVSVGSTHNGRLGAQIVSRNGVAAAGAFGAVYSDAGLFGAVAASTSAVAGETARGLVGELGGLANGGISDGELEAGKSLVIGRLLMGAESRAGLATAAGRGALFGKGESVAEAVAAVETLTRADVSAAVAKALGTPMSLVVVGDDSSVASSITLAKSL